MQHWGDSAGSGSSEGGAGARLWLEPNSLSGGFRKETLRNSHQSQRDEVTAGRANLTEYSLSPLWVPRLPPMLENEHVIRISG